MSQSYPFLISARRAAARWGTATLVLLALLLGSRPARATHIVGGELDLQYVTGNTYQLSLNLYFDAVNGNPGALDSDLTAVVFDKATNRRMATLIMPLTSNVFVSYSNPACAVGNLSTKALLYRGNLSLPPEVYNAAQGYYVVVERCCRNSTIGNIVNPGSAAQAFYLEFPAVVRNGATFRDSTPRIFPPLADYACLGELFTYDFAGQDPDGDSLAYDLVTPFNGHATASLPKPDASPAPYDPIIWMPGLGTTNQIPGNPALTVGARTGRLQVRPTQQGLFVFGVRCTEYRRGVKIGETRRDFQLMVLLCPRNAAPSVALYTGAAGTTPYLPGRGDVLNIVPGGPRCVRLRFTDPDPSSRLTVSLLRVDYTGPLPTFTTATTGTVHAAGQPDTLVATLCFPECADTKGQVRHLDILVADNGCSLPKRDTVHLAFTASLPYNAPPTLTSTAGPTLPRRVRLGDVLTFDLVATDPEGDPITIQPSGAAATALASMGATITYDPQVGTQRVAHFRWPIDCRAVVDPIGAPLNLAFGCSSLSMCDNRQAAAPVTVPVVVEYVNAPPVLTTSFPPDSAGLPPVVRIVLGDTYSATLSGFDADFNTLALSTVQDFDLAGAGMRFTSTSRPAGQAAATFTWTASCDGGSVQGGQPQERVVQFKLQEDACRPLPQTRTVRFLVVNPDQQLKNVPPNIILPNSPIAANNALTMAKMPVDFCDARFGEIRIFSRWGRLVYQSSNRDFSWGGEGVSGTYYYLLTYTSGHRFKGWVDVVR